MIGWICMFFARRFSQMHRIYRSWRDDSKSIGFSYCQCGYCWCPIRTCNFPICNFSASSHLFDGVGGGWESAQVISDWLRLWATRGFGAELKGFARGVGKNHPMPSLCLLKFILNQSITVHVQSLQFYIFQVRKIRISKRSRTTVAQVAHSPTSCH